jgi:hypothetical protein
MKAIHHIKKVFHHDIVALALACIISLLFTNRVAEFFNHINKKQDQSLSIFSFSLHGSQEMEKLTNVQSPLEDLNEHFTQYAVAPSVIRLQRLVAVYSQTKVGLVGRSGDKSFEQHPNYILPVGWSTSISIAQRKLII